MKFSAHLVMPGDGQVLPKAIVEVDRTGLVLSLTPTETELREQAGMEFHSGIICPALVNFWAHGSKADILQKMPELGHYESLIPPVTNDFRASFNWLKSICQIHPETSLPELIRLFTMDAAKAFALPESGLIAPGKRPGLVLISGVDYTNLKLTDTAKLKKLI